MVLYSGVRKYVADDKLLNKNTIIPNIQIINPVDLIKKLE
jgi:hypothetical protein